MSEVVHVKWYATILRGDLFADAVTEMAPVSLRYGATRYAVHRSLDDRYSILLMIWFENHRDWVRFWEGPELIEFRARYAAKYQAPIAYVPHQELTSGELGPQVPREAAAPAPVASPSAA